MRGWEHNPHGWGTEAWIGPLVMLAFLAAIMVIVVIVIQSIGSRHHVPSAGGPLGSTPVIQGSFGVNQAAIQILEERYARGDIEREEFMQRRQDLWSVPGPGVSPAPGPSAAE